MKYQILLIFGLLTTTLHSQNSFTSNEKRDSILFKNIKDLAISVSDKQMKLDKLVWYHSDSTLSMRKSLKRFKRDLHKSKQTMDYYFDRNISKTGYIQYSVHFYVKNNNEQHSKIYVGYKPDELIADYIQIDTKDDINLMKAEWRSQVSDIPPPPFPMMKKN
ncbi:hypothetical protein [Maribacter polysaccharolyticus]|uniref:hypothetical protein n=1 Tax=Maribacter polysaccharolyticus TaxID=3020831 RepID=UPI00237F8290|nr:hypothetical protein [Maribacter polysaccharolyticus]MDE3743623.1 hypothetical protein [Maribacter polysaccharolyticus]